MASDELVNHLRMKELHSWRYLVDVIPCMVCAKVCDECARLVQLPASGVLDLKDYSEEMIRDLSEMMKQRGLRFRVEEFGRDWEDEGDR